MKDLVKQVSTHVVGKNELVEQAFYALVMNEHQLLFGDPGTAKSYLADKLFEAIGTEPFRIQLTKYMDDSNLFGIVNFEKIKQGIVERNYEDSLLNNQYAFLDEFFDANDNTLRLLLQVLNERRYEEGNFTLNKLPLKTVIATTNFMRENDVTAAVLDRFVFKADSVSMKLEQHLKLNNLKQSPIDKIDVDAIQTELKKSTIDIDNDLLEIMFTIKTDFKKETGISVSDRTFQKTIKFVKMIAFLDGRTEVDMGDLKKLRFIWGRLGSKDSNTLVTLIKKRLKNPKVLSTIKKEIDNLDKKLEAVHKTYGIDFGKLASGDIDDSITSSANTILEEYTNLIKEVTTLSKNPDMNEDLKKKVAKAMKVTKYQKAVIQSLCISE